MGNCTYFSSTQREVVKMPPGGGKALKRWLRISPLACSLHCSLVAFVSELIQDEAALRRTEGNAF